MRYKKWLPAALPCLTLSTVFAVLLPSCGRREQPAVPVGTDVQALGSDGGVNRPACDPGSCAPLDELDTTPMTGSGWVSLSSFCDGGSCCSGGGSCDVTVPLQKAVNAIAKNTMAALWEQTSVVPTNLYIPPGSYTIQKPIFVQGAYGGFIVGDDPATTTISWGGPTSGAGPGTAGSPMFLFLDSTDTKLARITLDGGLSSAPTSDGGPTPWVAGVQIVQSRDGYAPPLQDDGGTASYLSTYNLEFDDLVFQNLSFGIASYTFAVDYEDVGGAVFYEGGTAYDLSTGFPVVDSNLGSIDVRRSSFENVLVTGVAVTGQNTLDWLIEDNAFINCHRGVSIEYNASANLVDNLFFNNNGDDVLDVYSNGGMSEVYRGNVSVGANVFYVGLYGQNLDLSGNYILLNPSASGGGSNPHCYGVVSAGSTLFLDNYVSGPNSGDACTLEQTGAGCTHAATYHALGVYGTIAHGHNAYSGTASGLLINPGTSGYNTEEMCVGGAAGCPGTGQSADSFGVAPTGAIPAAAANAYAGWGSPTPGMPTANVQRPTIAPKTARTLLAVPTSCKSSPGTGCAGDLTTLLAGQSTSGQYVVYFPRAYYYVDGQVEIPAGLDVVIAGDGTGTQLLWTGAALDKYVFHAHAPAKAMFRDFAIVAVGSGSRPGGILVDSQDDTGGLVYIDNGAVSGAKSAIELAGLDNVLVRAEQWGGGVERVADVIGGGAGGVASSGTQGYFSLAGGSNPVADYVTVRNWGKAIFVGSDNEGDTQGTVLTQSGYVTMDAGRFMVGPQNVLPGLYPAQPNFVAGTTFRGNLTFANMQTTAGVFSTGARQAQVLALGNHYGAIPGLPNTPVPLPCGTLPAPDCTSPLVVPGAYVEQASGGATQMGLQNEGTCTISGTPATAFYADVQNGSAAPGTFADTMLADLRSAPYAAPICASTCGQTRVRMHNVWMTGGDASVYAFGMPPSTYLRTGVRVQRSN